MSTTTNLVTTQNWQETE